MSELVPPAVEVLPDLGNNLPVEAVALVRAYQRASKAEATVRAYTGDALVFEAWCRRYGFRSLPATPETVAGFLAAEAEAGLVASTLGRRLAAIRYAHKLAGEPDPTDDEGVPDARSRLLRRRRPRGSYRTCPTTLALPAIGAELSFQMPYAVGTSPGCTPRGY